MSWFTKKSKNISDTPPQSPPDSPPAVDTPRESGEAPSSAALEENGKKKGIFTRLRSGLAKTRQILTTDIEDLFQGKHQLDDEMLEEIEELLITSDIGVRTADELISAISKSASNITSSEELKAVLKDEILSQLATIEPAQPIDVTAKPHVVMVVGVNGVGKTTTIGKLAASKVQQGNSVLIGAADTFRAAAIEQLAIWAQRAGADFVQHKANADPAAVAYDSIVAGQSRGIDWVFIDTAGRLHTKVNLMEELKKIKRSIAKVLPDAPHETLLVLDATTGQNAISQAKLFNEALDGITGLALTKLDGTAKGGVVISICKELNLPIQYIGVGEAIEDLQPFDAKQYVDALI